MSAITEQFSLAARVFVVTGASSGIGRAMAGFLAQAGGRVIGVARQADALRELVTEITAAGGEAAMVVADLQDRAALPDIAEQCRAPFGPVDGVVNAAGVNFRQPSAAVTIEAWDTTLQLNLSVPFFFSRAFVPAMQQRGYGRIINIASLQSCRAFPDSIPYGASKGGVCQLTRAMAEAWSPLGITCNAIAPGFFPTPLTAPVFTDPARRAWAAKQTAVGRNGELSDLFGATIFFAAPATAYITGQTLFVDGGFTAR